MCLCFSGESNTQMVSLTEELSQKNKDLMKQQEEISQLLSQIVELQQRLKQVSNVENGQTDRDTGKDRGQGCVSKMRDDEEGEPENRIEREIERENKKADEEEMVIVR